MSSKNQSVPRILLTGATGFVGPLLLEELKQGFFRNAEVFVWAYDPVMSRDDPFNVDICSRDEVFGSIEACRPTHIVHLAAQSHVPTSFKQPELTWDVNVKGTLHLFEAVREHVPDAGIIFVSSSEVYGRSFQGGAPLDETALLQPQNPYAASKAAADLMAGQYAAQGMHIIRLRPFNHIGPGQREEFVASSFAAQVARVEARQQPPVIKVGNLQARRDFLDVRDVIRAYTLALERLFDLPAGLVLNVCSGVPRKIEDLLTGLIDRASVPIPISVDPDRLRPSDTPLAVGVADEIKRYLGWYAEITFEQTLQDILAEWRNKVRLPDLIR